MYYRADKRDFSVDDLIVTAGNFQSLNPNGSDAIEAIFERVRPANKPVRATSLFLFVDERSAKKHWSKMTGGCLYIVEADQSGCIHKGDMRLVDQAFGVRHDQDFVSEIATRYWDGFLTEDPIVEVLVASAVVTNIVSKDQNERVAYFKSWALA